MRAEPTNDKDTWWVDWSKPICWNDGTPAEIYGDVWSGQAHVLLNPEILPLGFKAGGLRHIATKPPGDPWEKAICTNVMACKGTTMYPMECYVMNVEDFHAQAAMEESEAWGSF